jgi:hypothetical protein
MKNLGVQMTTMSEQIDMLTTEGYLPIINSHALGACGRGDRFRATPAVNICHRHGARIRRKADERELRGNAEGKGKEREGRETGKR